MSKPGTIYRIKWQSFSPPDPVTGEPLADLQCVCDITDNDYLIPDDDPVDIIELEGAGQPAQLSVIDNAEDPFTVILAQQLTMRFNSTITVGMSTFVTGSDQRYNVHYYLATNTQTIFKGFLVSGDNAISEDFLYPPNTVTLTANDGLPLLKDIPLVTNLGANPTSYQKIIDYLYWALLQTGLVLEFRVAFNIKLVGMNDDISIPNGNNEHLFSNVYLDAKTFEDEIGTCLNAYRCIEIIFGPLARLFQFQGQWWIMRVDEVEDATRGLYITSFEDDGSFEQNRGNFDFVKQIGDSKDIYFSDAATQVTATRATKSLRLNFNYDLPKEVPCNADFSRGVSGEIIISPTEKHYDIDCWTLLENRPLVTSTHAVAYIVKKYTNGYENERYALIDKASSLIEQMLTSEWIYVGQHDLFDLSVQVKHDGQIDTGSGPVRGSYMQVHLFADDGTFYNLNGGRSDTGTVPVWRLCTSDFNTNQSYFGVTYDAADDDTEYKLVGFESGDCPPIPKTGKIRILLCATYKVTTFQTIFSPVSFTLRPFVNGSNDKYTGQYHSCSQVDPATGKYKKKIELPVYMSDAPCKLYKGAMFVYNSGTNTYDIAGLFYDASKLPTGPADADKKRYGEIQLYDVWNQNKNEMRVVQATAQGVDIDKTKFTFPYPAHLINKYSLTDNTEHTNFKFFILLHFEQDHATGAWTGVLRECFDTTKAKDYSNHVFKYIS